MHEASIALSILETVIAQCARDGYRAIESVRVRVGRGSNILPEALTFAFEAAKRETIAAEASLIVEEVGLAAVCLSCGQTAELPDRFSLECPACSRPTLQIVSGCEMEIVDMEVSES